MRLEIVELYRIRPTSLQSCPFLRQEDFDSRKRFIF